MLAFATTKPLPEIFTDLEAWVTFHPLGAILIVLIAWGIWFRKDRF